MRDYRIETISRLAGFDVIVTDRLPEDAMYAYLVHRKVFCGSLAHAKYQIAKAQVVLDIRADLEKQLDAFAKRVGVDRSTMSE